MSPLFMRAESYLNRKTRKPDYSATGYFLSEKFDGQGKFIRRYVPELASCADKWIHAPWLMPAHEQERSGIVIGQHYPAPIVDHAAARIKSLALYQAATG